MGHVRDPGTMLTPAKRAASVRAVESGAPRSTQSDRPPSGSAPFHAGRTSSKDR
jgi:hypothetical protein